jgi:hypothetical protein
MVYVSQKISLDTPLKGLRLITAVFSQCRDRFLIFQSNKPIFKEVKSVKISLFLLKILRIDYIIYINFNELFVH